MTPEEEQRLFDMAQEDLPEETNVLGPFYRGYTQGILAVIKILRAERWSPER